MQSICAVKCLNDCKIGYAFFIHDHYYAVKSTTIIQIATLGGMDFMPISAEELMMNFIIIDERCYLKPIQNPLF